MADFDRRMRRVARLYLDALRATPVQRVTINATRYDFDLDPLVLANLLEEIERAVDRILLEGGQDQLWFSIGYVVPSYEAGTAANWRNIGVQSERYALARPTLQSILTSEPYRRRIGYLKARQFEGMKGLSAQTKADLGRILTDGFAQGLNPRDVARQLTEQAGIEARRGHRIARTEIPNALRQARLDEAQQAATDFGIRSLEMHFSALSPTTRASHAARHGTLHNSQEQREWWAVDANSINCYLPGTRVAGRFVAGSKARYDGPTVRLVAADGSDLTVTSNHPVMTPGGLRAAAEIREGDYLVAYRGQVDHSVGVVELDRQLTQPCVEDVFSTLADLGQPLRARVNAVDFHGDAWFMHEDIEVVRSDRELPCALDSLLAQCLDQLKLVHSDPVFRAAVGPERLGLIGVYPAPAGFMGSGGIGGAFGGGHLGRPGESALAAVAGGEAGVSKPSHDDRAGHPEAFAEFLDRYAGQVDLVQVVDVRYGQFSGHVYDLEESSGLMVANGIIASNCKCSTITTLVDEKGEPLDPSVVERVKGMRKG